MEDAEQAYRKAVTQAYNALGFAGFGASAPGPHQLPKFGAKRGGLT